MPDSKRTISKKDLFEMLKDIPDDAKICVEQNNVYNDHQFAEFNNKLTPVQSKETIYSIATSSDWN